jgi:hypothetical protein
VAGRKQQPPSDRSFGSVFTGVFALIGFWSVLIHGAQPKWWAVIVALGFAVVTLLRPQLLRPLNFVWYRIGRALHRIVNPILMAVIYFGAVVPMGVFMRARGSDPMRLKKHPGTDSHWVRRATASPTDLRKQF